MTSSRSWLRDLTPRPVRRWAANRKLRTIRQRNAERPIAEVFAEVYDWGKWGNERYDSGSGSRGEAAERYAEYVRDLIAESGARSVVDIGCGDFQVAARFAPAVHSYHGIDVVADLIERNKNDFGTSTVKFSVLDAASATPPSADICLIRQVLQHLSNQQITSILRNCQHYQLVVITEHWPAAVAARKPNVDKPHGPDTRLDRGSWVDISAAPFGLAVEEVLQIPVPTPLYQDGETIRTHLWRPGQRPV